MTFSSVRVRMLPWRPRWRSKKGERDFDLDLPDLGDDPVSLVISLVFLLIGLPVLLFLVLGLLVFSAEIAILMALIPLLMLGQIVGLLPWTLVLRTPDGERSQLQVKGTRSMLAARASYRG